MLAATVQLIFFLGIRFKKSARNIFRFISKKISHIKMFKIYFFVIQLKTKQQQNKYIFLLFKLKKN